LIHGDLQPRHVFFDSIKQKIAGVIDFEDIWISDPDYELSYLLTEFGEEFGERLLCRYGHAHPDRLRWKSHLFELCRCIDDIVWGIEDDHPEEAAEGWRNLRSFLERTDITQSSSH
jgi:aminoglycoside 2''-phosphotransferase